MRCFFLGILGDQAQTAVDNIDNEVDQPGVPQDAQPEIYWAAQSIADRYFSSIFLILYTIQSYNEY